MVLFVFTLDLNGFLAVIELLARKLRLERVDRVELILLDTSIGHVTLFELSFLGRKTLRRKAETKVSVTSLKMFARLFH